MEQLPLELSCRILSLLDYRHLVTAGLVCRSWNFLASRSVLWQDLYTQRWGQEQNEGISIHQKSWKAAYECRDRCDRIGLEMTIIPEGSNYLLVNRGEVLHFLGSSTKTIVQKEPMSAVPFCNINNNQVRRSTTTLSDSEGCIQEVNMEVCDSSQLNKPCLGLIDKLFFFVGDLEYAMRQAKRHRTF